MPDNTLKNIKENWLLYLVLLLGFLVYSKTLFYGYISWDDPEMVFKNQAVKTFDIKAFFTNHYVGNYIPITMLIHAMAWLLFQDWAGGHHLLSLSLHLINAFFVYKLSLLLFKNKQVSLFALVIFLFHPLQIESVVWISEIKTILSATFFLTSCLCFIQYLQTNHFKYYLFSFLLFCFAGLSKPSVLMLPFILFMIEWYSNNKILLNTFLKQIPFLLVSCIIGYITIQTQTADQFINHAHEFNFYTQIGFAGLAYFNYLVLFFLPLNLSVIYTFPAATIGNILIGYLSLLFLVLIGIYFLKTKRTNLSLALFFFIINLVLVLQFIPFGEALFADRYMYLAIIGLAWLIAFVFQRFKIDNITVLALLLILNIIFCFNRITIWQNALTVYEDVIKKYPEQFVALNSAGVECMRLNRHDESLNYFQKAVRSAPNNYKGYYNTGLLYLKNNQPQQAIESFNRTINLYEYYKAYTARASAYYMLNDLPKAMMDANKVLSLENNNGKAHFILGNCYNDLNQLDNAIAEYNLAIRSNAEESDYYFKRAIALGKKQQFNNCLNDLIVCLELNPNNFEAYYWKGVSLVNLKKNPCEDFKIAAQNNFEPAINALNKYCR